MATPTHDELRQYLRFTEADRERLGGVLHVVQPTFGAIVLQFYGRVLAHPGAASVFTSGEQIDRQTAALIRWLGRFFAAPRDDTYFRDTARIGQVHTSVGLPQGYLIVSMNVLRMALDSTIRAARRDDESEVLGSLHRGLDLELAIMVDSYVTAAIARSLRP